MPEKEPVIIMTVRPGGVTVGVDNTEGLLPEQKLGFDILTAAIRHFAKKLFNRSVELQNARPETVN